MGFHPFDVTVPHIAYACIGGFVVLFGMFSLLLREKLYIGEACFAFLFGVVIGPNGANIFNPRLWAPSDSPLLDSENLNSITLEITRIVLAIGVFAIGVELPKQYMKKHWRSLFFLLVPVMTWGWFVSASLIFVLIPGLSFLSALAIAACLTPTDPILAAAVVGGKYADKHVPAHLRHRMSSVICRFTPPCDTCFGFADLVKVLAAESGCNDGAAFPFLFIALYLTLDSSDAHAVQDWFLITFLYEVLLGVVFGSLLGFGFRHLMRFCERKDLIDRKSYVAQYVSLALFSVGTTTLLGSDDLLAAFASGTAFAWDGFFNKQTEDSAFSSVIDLLFNIAAFIYIGAWMPFHLFSSVVLNLTVWRLIVLAILILLLRRLPIVMALYRWIPDIKTFREAVFSGHFGPIGVGGVFISTLAVAQLPRPHDPPENQVEMLAASIQPIVAFMVLCSITIHGLSIPFFSLGRRVHSVSRSWSRHPSMDLGGPEWAMQTRRVVRAEDVIVNRDRQDDPDVVERGESEKVESDMTIGTPRKTRREHELFDGEESPKDENPPDGTGRDGDDTEWREGPHLIIEHGHGPGNETEVEVIRNTFTNNSKEKVSRAFRGSEASAHKEVQKLTHVEREIARKLRDKKEYLGNKEEKGFRHVEDILHDHGDHDQEHDEREEDWLDEDVGTEGAEPYPSSSGARSSSSERKRSKSPKFKSPKLPVLVQSRKSASKRRETFRRGVLGARPKVQASLSRPASTPNDSSPEEEERRERGREAGPTVVPRLHGARSGTHTPRDSVARLRFDSLRASSPVRSIRFADEPVTPSLGTPSLGTPILRPSTPLVDDTPTGSGTDDLSKSHSLRMHRRGDINVAT